MSNNNTNGSQMNINSQDKYIIHNCEVMVAEHTFLSQHVDEIFEENVVQFSF